MDLNGSVLFAYDHCGLYTGTDPKMSVFTWELIQFVAIIGSHSKIFVKAVGCQLK